MPTRISVASAAIAPATTNVFTPPLFEVERAEVATVSASNVDDVVVDTFPAIGGTTKVEAVGGAVTGGAVGAGAGAAVVAGARVVTGAAGGDVTGGEVTGGAVTGGDVVGGGHSTRRNSPVVGSGAKQSLVLAAPAEGTKATSMPTAMIAARISWTATQRDERRRDVQVTRSMALEPGRPPYAGIPAGRTEISPPLTMVTRISGGRHVGLLPRSVKEPSPGASRAPRGRRL